MAAIDFLNPAPLMWDFEHAPQRERLLRRYEVDYTTPARCAEQLAEGSADVGLIPVAAYATIPSLVVVPGCAIASLDRVRSILLVVRAARGLGPLEGMSAVRRVAADTSSRTSYAYARILFRGYWKTEVEFVPHAPALESMLAVADAALLIGDPALLALEDRAAREQRTGERLLYLDLAHEWHTWTGLPWISAFWALREDAVRVHGANEIVSDFQLSKEHGLAHLDDLVEEWKARIAVPAETIRTYLTSNIHYTLDTACLEGLAAFYRYAADAGVLPEAPALRLL